MTTSPVERLMTAQRGARPRPGANGQKKQAWPAPSPSNNFNTMSKQIVPQHLELTPAEAALYERYYRMGRRHALGIVDSNVPRIGTRIERSVDYIGLGPVVTDHNAKEYHQLLCYAEEQDRRQHSPFERTAKEINEDEVLGSEYGWDAFESGVADCIGEGLRCCDICPLPPASSGGYDDYQPLSYVG